jgi:Transposase
MGSIPRSFTEEFGVPAVTLVMDDHASMADLARNNGVQEMKLGKWPRKQAPLLDPWVISGAVGGVVVGSSRRGRAWPEPRVLRGW